jgi:WD40 repeat protein
MLTRHAWLPAATALALAVSAGCSRPSSTPDTDNRGGPPLSLRPSPGSQPKAGGQPNPGGQPQPSPGQGNEPIELKGWPRSLAYSPDGALLVVGNDSHPPILVDTATRKARVPWKGEDSVSWAAAFSRDGKRVADGAMLRSDDNRVNLWDVGTGDLVKAFKGHTGRILCVALSPDGKTVASGGQDKLLIVWDVDTGKEKYTKKDPHKGDVACVAFSPDGKTLATAGDDATVRLWEADSGKEVKALPVNIPEESSNEVRALAYSPDGKTLAVAGFFKAVQLWDVEAGKRKHLLKGSDWIRAVAFSPDGKTVASGGDDKTVTLWDAGTGARRTPLEGHRRGVTALAFSPVGGRLASGSNDSTIRLWEVEKALAQKK